MICRLTGSIRLDQDTSQQTNPEQFDPEEELRDYGSLAINLPVFCVSSRTYQSFRSPVRRGEVQIPGFDTPEATEIPQLISHAKKLTETRRTQASNRFLNGFLQNINSLYLWVTQGQDELELADEETQAQVDSIKSSLVGLEKVYRPRPYRHIFLMSCR